MRLIVPGLVLALMLPPVSRAVPVQDGECEKFNRCHAEHGKERKACPGCGNRKIPGEDALCSSCARKQQVCAHCGNPRKGSGNRPRPAVRNIEEAMKLITEEDLRKLLSWVASDELEGRCTGYPGEQKVTERFAEIYRAAGLKPGGENGTYFQAVPAGQRQGRNTIALLEGTDRKNEFVLIGGHHDHIGRGGQLRSQQRGGPQGGDDIYNGADDNGSGCTCVVTIARAFGESGLRPRRTIIFMTFTAEEMGLVGSRHYVRNPIHSIQNTIAMLNMDMVGRNSEKPVAIRGTGTEAGNLFETLVSQAAQKTGWKFQPVDRSQISGGDSDHTSFRRANVPVLFFDAGVHADWHMVSDHVDRINFKQMEAVARAAMYVLWELANTDQRPQFVDR